MERYSSVFQQFQGARGVDCFSNGAGFLCPDWSQGDGTRYAGDRGAFLLQHQVADLYVIGSYGLSLSDQTLPSQLEDEATVEYGYFQDAVVKDTTLSFRIFSTPNELSTYELVEGNLPKKTDEIVLSAAYQADYAIGDRITFEEKADADSQLLTEHSFIITGFVNSSELLSRVNLGQSTAGSGELNGYAVVAKETFDSEVYTIARIAYDDLADLSPFGQTYLDKVYDNKKQVKEMIAGQAAVRLAEVKASAQETIDSGYEKLAQAKASLASAENQLADARQQLSDGESQLASGQAELASAQKQLTDAASQLATGKASLESSASQLNTASQQLSSGWSQLSTSKARLDEAAQQIEQAEQTLKSKKDELDSAAVQLALASQTIAEKEQALADTKVILDEKSSELAVAKQALEQVAAEIAAGQTALEEAKASLEQEIAQLQSMGIDPDTLAAIGDAQAEISQKEASLTAAFSAYQSNFAEYETAAALLSQKTEEYQAGLAQLTAAKEELASKQA